MSLRAPINDQVRWFRYEVPHMHFSHLRLLIKKLVTKRLTTIGTSPYPILLLGLIPEFNTEALISIKAPHGHCN